MKLVKSLTLGLLIFTFAFANLSSQNNTIFLYGSVHGEYNQIYMENLYINMAEEIENRRNIIQFWPKNTDYSGFCNSGEINEIYESVFENPDYLILENQIIKYYQKTRKQINIIAIGNGISVLQELLQISAKRKCKFINKAIIIESANLLRASRSNSAKNPFVREIVSAELLDNGEIVLTKISNQNNPSKYIEDQEEESEYSYCDTESEVDISKEEYVTESGCDEYSETEPNDINSSDTDSSDTDLSNKVVVIDAQEYLELLERQERVDRSCCDWFTADRIGALAKAGVLIATTVVALV